MSFIHDKFNIPKNCLMLIAGIFWMVAGIMVLITGLPIFINIISPLNIISSTFIFLIFYLYIFSKLVNKHTQRIRINDKKRMAVWQFFDTSSYIIMIIMMVAGIELRVLHLLPDWIIGPFYSGLGIALFTSGIRFVVAFIQKKVLQKV